MQVNFRTSKKQPKSSQEIRLVLYVKDRDYFGLNTPLGLMRISVVPMGFTNSVAIFQRGMVKIEEDLIPQKCELFIDDSLVQAKKGADIEFESK